MRLLAGAFVLLFVVALHPSDATAEQAQPAPAMQAAPTQTPTTAYTLSSDKLAKAKALYILRSRLLIIETVFSFAVLLVILYTGIAARYRDWAERVSRRRFVQAVIFIPLLLITIDLFGLPFDIYQHHIGLQYGLSIQKWGSWFADVIKGEAIGLVIATHLLWILIWIIRRSPRLWWFYFW